MDIREQAITGVVPPQVAEARIREAWPSVARLPAIASLGKALTRTIVLAPVAWVVMGLFYFSKLFPVLMRRYTLTNRRLMVRKGWAGTPTKEVALADIDEVRVVTDANSDFFRAGTLEVVSNGQVVLTLAGLPEPEAFRHAVINACTAWVPGKAKTLPFIAASAVK
jgi:hypothetical protein